MKSTRRGFLGGLLALAAACAVPFLPRRQAPLVLYRGHEKILTEVAIRRADDMIRNRRNFHKSREGSVYFRHVQPYTYNAPIS